MPRDSSWNTAVVLAVFNKWKVALSSIGKVAKDKGGKPSKARCLLALSRANSNMVKVRKPKKSNLTKPTASTSSLSYWLTKLPPSAWQ